MNICETKLAGIDWTGIAKVQCVAKFIEVGAANKVKVWVQWPTEGSKTKVWLKVVL